ncbi:MAG: rhomboid family intramembrane serine protease [Planctomycetes bacterium]|nr:rhomboid family intramembrane serine protease [Planctomycetota bacterium]
MIPLRDNIPPRTFPFVNYSIIAATSLVWALQLIEPEGMDRLVERYGMIPARVVHPERNIVVRELASRETRRGLRPVLVERAAEPAAVPALLTLLTCIFLHGGWLHFLGNVWVLFIFGDNVEDRLGKPGYLVFYLASGVAASAAHLLSDPGSSVPTIGASGAIAGVMGAYFLLYPRAMVLTLVPIFFLQVLVLPAPVFLGLWFLLQFFQGTLSITSTQAGGVAWWAHIGGFVTGAALVVVLKSLGTLRPPVTSVRPRADHVTVYRVRPFRKDWP